MAFSEASEILAPGYSVPEATFAPGKYKNITGNTGIAHGLVAAAQLADRTLVYAGYPITPASDILHELSRLKHLDAVTFQAEDEIAACCSAIGAAYGGQLGVTASSGPGISLKQEAINLAVMAELPLVIIDAQRAGPSTGMPTKTEQSDLFQSLYGRNGDSPCVVVAISRPSDAFETTVEACKIALEHMVPVFLLSDGYIGNGSEPWKIPEVSSLPEIVPPAVTGDSDSFQPYTRNPETLVREWATPGMKGLEHRIGGLEKEDVTGNVCYDGENHQRMTDLRADKVERIANALPSSEIEGDTSGELLVIGWGGTYSAIAGATKVAREEGLSIGHLHLRFLNPLPKDIEEVMSKYQRVVVPELNCGQLCSVLRACFGKDIESISQVTGQPFRIADLVQSFLALRGN